VRALVGRLRIGDFRSAQRAAAAARDLEPPRELRGREDHLRGLGRAESRRAGAHRDGSDERPENHRSARTHELRERHAGECLGKNFRQAAGGGHRTHGPGEHRGHDNGSLVVAGEYPQRAQHPAVVYQR